jgi:hypothetical protein
MCNHGQEVKARLRSDARAALSVPGRGPVRKLSLFVEGLDDKYCRDVMGKSLLKSLLSVPALRHIEELRVGFELTKKLRFTYNLRPATWHAPCAGPRLLQPQAATAWRWR